MLVEGLRTDVMRPFAKGKILSSRRRRDLAKVFEKKMTFAQAWIIAREYAMGKMDEDAEHLKELIQAWFVLGEERFQIIFSVVRAFARAAELGRLVLRQLINMIQEFLPSAPVSDITSDVDAVKLQFRSVEVVV